MRDRVLEEFVKKIIFCEKFLTGGLKKFFLIRDVIYKEPQTRLVKHSGRYLKMLRE